MDRDVKWLKEQIELRQADILFYSTKTDELIEKAKKEEAHKLHSTTPHKSQKELADKVILLMVPPANQVDSYLNGQDLTMTSAAREDVLEMTEKRIILENERSMITNQIRECSLECDRLNDQWKILKGFAKSINVDVWVTEQIWTKLGLILLSFQSIRVMNDEIEQWKLKVGQLNNQIDKLQKMEDYASLANSQLRTNLAVLKPYDKEYQEFESLVESNKQLNDQLAKHEFKQKVEELKYSRDIQFVP
uniref:Uncharacterized protein n=1 Tax=Caenorhabditis japonica TaxID=281687 RepID=A0A8R1HTF2_CAEJA